MGRVDLLNKPVNCAEHQRASQVCSRRQGSEETERSSGGELELLGPQVGWLYMVTDVEDAPRRRRSTTRLLTTSWTRQTVAGRSREVAA